MLMVFLNASDAINMTRSHVNYPRRRVMPQAPTYNIDCTLHMIA